jgi:hypothetical protein
MELVKVLGYQTEVRLSAVDCVTLAKALDRYADGCSGDDVEERQAAITSLATAFRGLAIAGALIASFLPPSLEALQSAVDELGLQDLVGV